MKNCKLITATGFQEKLDRFYVFEGWLKMIGSAAGKSMEKTEFTSLIGAPIDGDDEYYKEWRTNCLAFVREQPDGTKFMFVTDEDSKFDPYNFPMGKERIQGEFRFYDEAV